MGQGTFDFDNPGGGDPAPPPPPSRREQFEAYDRDNPQVWRMFVRLARQARRKGFARYSARALFHLIRWHTGVGADGDEFKVNDKWSPWYARKLERAHPEFRGFFEQRRMRKR